MKMLGVRRNEKFPALIGFIIASLIAYVTMQWSIPAPIESFSRTPSATMVKAGDRVTVTWKELRNRKCDAIVHRRLIAADKKITEFETQYVPAKPVGVEVQGEFSFVVPTGLADGPLIFRVNAEYRCNTVQRMMGGSEFVLPDIVFAYRQDG